MIKKEKDLYYTGRGDDWKGSSNKNRYGTNLGGKEYLMARVDEQ